MQYMVLGKPVPQDICDEFDRLVTEPFTMSALQKILAPRIAAAGICTRSRADQAVVYLVQRARNDRRIVFHKQHLQWTPVGGAPVLAFPDPIGIVVDARQGETSRELVVTFTNTLDLDRWLAFFTSAKTAEAGRRGNVARRRTANKMARRVGHDAFDRPTYDFGTHQRNGVTLSGSGRS